MPAGESSSAGCMTRWTGLALHGFGHQLNASHRLPRTSGDGDVHRACQHKMSWQDPLMTQSGPSRTQSGPRCGCQFAASNGRTLTRSPRRRVRAHWEEF